MEHLMDALVARCERIAKANNDEFRYIIEVAFNPQTKKCGYDLMVEESSEGHLFTEGIAMTLQAAVEIAQDGIPEALEAWGYKEPKRQSKEGEYK